MRVLILDDDATNLTVMAAIVRRLDGCEPVVFPEPRAALAWMAVDQPDLILLDHMMPGIAGLDVLRRIRAEEHLRDVPVVMVTADHLDDTRLAALDEGATDFVTKPIRPAEFRARIRNLLTLRRSQRLLADRAAHLAGEVALATEALRARELELLTRLCRAAEFRDPETGAHVERMAHFARLTAEGMDLPAAWVAELHHAAPLHDVGKLGIPDAILLKPGRLSDAEMAIMRGHAQIGHDILRDSQAPLIRLGAEIALTHHEKWDGTGYPRGLAGAAIPLVGRITAVADVFDALASARPYKPAWTLEAARAFLVEQRGRHFDPAALDAFLRRWDDVLRIRQLHADPAAR